MASPRHPTTIENLPDDVLSHIFIRLLAKQLAQMRCICKSWNAFLSESSFVKSHLHHSIHNNDETLWFLRWDLISNEFFFTSCPSHSLDLELTNYIKLPISPQSIIHRICIGGSVNGLICFYYKSYHDGYVVAIWNPSLSALLTLPPCSLPSHILPLINFRFGFDHRTDDYKVVKVTGIPFPLVKNWLQVEVYSMRKGCWKFIPQTFPSHVTTIDDRDEVCVDGHGGHLYWLGYTDSEWKVKTIVAFNLVAETFREIPLPHAVPDYSFWLSFIGVLAKKLCMMSRARDGGYEVWVMNEYGVVESWIKHHEFSLSNASIITAYGFTSHKNFLFKADYDDTFGLYDPVAAKAKAFKLRGRQSGMIKVVEYVDSLVWFAPKISKSQV